MLLSYPGPAPFRKSPVTKPECPESLLCRGSRCYWAKVCEALTITSYEIRYHQIDSYNRLGTGKKRYRITTNHIPAREGFAAQTPAILDIFLIFNFYTCNSPLPLIFDHAISLYHEKGYANLLLEPLLASLLKKTFDLSDVDRPAHTNPELVDLKAC